MPEYMRPKYAHEPKDKKSEAVAANISTNQRRTQEYAPTKHYNADNKKAPPEPVFRNVPTSKTEYAPPKHYATPVAPSQEPEPTHATRVAVQQSKCTCGKCGASNQIDLTKSDLWQPCKCSGNVCNETDPLVRERHILMDLIVRGEQRGGRWAEVQKARARLDEVNRILGERASAPSAPDSRGVPATKGTGPRAADPAGNERYAPPKAYFVTMATNEGFASRFAALKTMSAPDESFSARWKRIYEHLHPGEQTFITEGV
jgi:hypothetical protein